MTPPSFGDSATRSSLTQTTFWPFTHTHTIPIADSTRFYAPIALDEQRAAPRRQQKRRASHRRRSRGMWGGLHAGAEVQFLGVPRRTLGETIDGFDTVQFK